MLYPIDHNECHGDTQQKQQCNAICVMIREGQDLSGPWSPAKPLMRFYPNPSHVCYDEGCRLACLVPPLHP